MTSGAAAEEELLNALQDISQFAPQLKSPFDRVRVAEWARRLTAEAFGVRGLASDANQYAQLLRIQSQEVLSHTTSLPLPGPLAPFVCRKSADGHVYVATRQIPGRGVLCYLAVSTHGLVED